MLARLSLAALTATCTFASSQPGTENGPANGLAEDDYLTVELATVGLDLQTQTPVVLLREAQSGLVVPLLVGVPEAQAIMRWLHGVEVPRPMTHDLMASLLATLGGVVEEVVVHDIRDNTYHAFIRLHGEENGNVYEVDSRPSDALALALRTGAPIRVADHLLGELPEFDFLAPEGEEQVVRTIGITVVAPTDELEQEFDLPARTGLVVIDASGEAAQKGLRRGDLIIEVNGRQPTEPLDLFNAVRDTVTDKFVMTYKAGEKKPVIKGAAE
jgi:uncharacterized protein